MVYGDYPDLTGVKKILVVKLRQLGDVLLTGPVFRALRNHLSEARIDAYVYTEAFPMLEGHSGVDHLVGYDRNWKKLGWWRRWKKEWELFRQIRGTGYDLAINLTEGDRGAFVAFAANAKIRVGFEPKGTWQKRLYTHVVKHCPGLRHTVERNLDALRRIGIFPKIEERELCLSVPEEARRKVKEWMDRPFVVIHPTSRWRFKCWPVEKVRALAEELIKRGKKIVLTSGPDEVEKAMVAEIARGLDVVNLSGKISLKELAALIEQSELLICVDSVPFHMANALKKRVVAIFGPTSDVTWGPWRNPEAVVVAQPFPCRPCYRDGCGGSKVSDCLTTLPVEWVLRAIDWISRDKQDFPEKVEGEILQRESQKNLGSFPGVYPDSQ